MSAFGPGDRVRCIRANGARILEVGREYEVVAAMDDNMLGPVVSLKDVPNPTMAAGYYAGRFELVRHQTPTDLLASAGLDQATLTRKGVVEVAHDAIGELDRRLVLVREHAKAVDAENKALEAQVRQLMDELHGLKRMTASEVRLGMLERWLDIAAGKLVKDRDDCAAAAVGRDTGAWLAFNAASGAYGQAVSVLRDARRAP